MTRWKLSGTTVVINDFRFSVLEKILTPLSALDTEEGDDFWGSFTYPENSRVIFLDGTHEVTEEKKKLKPHEHVSNKEGEHSGEQKVIQSGSYSFFFLLLFFAFVTET